MFKMIEFVLDYVFHENDSLWYNDMVYGYLIQEHD
jgi:hypothetical protein